MLCIFRMHRVSVKKEQTDFGVQAQCRSPGARAKFQPVLAHPAAACPLINPIPSPMLFNKLDPADRGVQMVAMEKDLGPGFGLGQKNPSTPPCHRMVQHTLG
eukprot:1150632-Pelagomonas_calceolata.AAC.3